MRGIIVSSATAEVLLSCVRDRFPPHSQEAIAAAACEVADELQKLYLAEPALSVVPRIPSTSTGEVTWKRGIVPRKTRVR